METRSGKVVIIVQARVRSTRLPGKVLMKVLSRPLLSFLVERLRRVKKGEELIIATTDNPEDDEIVAFCKQNGVQFYRGSESDVLDRYYRTANQCQADVIVRITADCPLIDPDVVDKVIEYYLMNSYDYVGNTLKLTYPRGMDTEVFSMEALKRANAEAKEKSEKEHVTLYMYRHPDKFRLANVSFNGNMSHYRLTVDTEDDFALIKGIIETLYPKKANFKLEDILLLLNQRPELAQMNVHVKQKPIEED